MNDMRIDTPKDLVGALLSGLVCWLHAGSDDRDLGNFLGRVTGVAHEDESGKSYNITMQIHEMNHDALRWEPTGEVIETWKRWGHSDEYMEIVKAKPKRFEAFRDGFDLEKASATAEKLEAAYVEKFGHPSGVV